jgi:SEC-C motif domain protein
MLEVNARCPCGNASYAQCCGRLHRSAEMSQAARSAIDEETSPVALMRSRYSAYVLNLVNYLRHSWHPDTCPAELKPDHETRWLGLEILDKSTAADGQTASVRFSARFRESGGQTHRLQERSVFVRFEGRWVYWKAVN